MTPQERQKQLDEISSEDLARIKDHQASTQGSFAVDNEWMILAEWLQIAGYQAFLDAKNDTKDEKGNLIITMPEILTLIEATRKLKAMDFYRDAQASFIGAGSARSKKPSDTFRKLTKDIIKQTKVKD